MPKMVAALNLTDQEMFDFKVLAHLRGQSDRKCLSNIIRRELELRRELVEKFKRNMTEEELKELSGYGNTAGRPNKRTLTLEPKPLEPLLKLCLEDTDG